MNSIKEKFVEEVKNIKTVDVGSELNYLVVAIKLPTGAIELITNTECLGNKIHYYMNAYDENFKLKTNESIEIVGFMMV
jgi:hypothetical protein